VAEFLKLRTPILPQMRRANNHAALQSAEIDGADHLGRLPKPRDVQKPAALTPRDPIGPFGLVGENL
jgi:hypothetical protein